MYIILDFSGVIIWLIFHYFPLLKLGFAVEIKSKSIPFHLNKLVGPNEYFQTIGNISSKMTFLPSMGVILLIIWLKFHNLSLLKVNIVVKIKSKAHPLHLNKLVRPYD